MEADLQVGALRRVCCTNMPSWEQQHGPGRSMKAGTALSVLEHAGGSLHRMKAPGVSVGRRTQRMSGWSSNVRRALGAAQSPLRVFSFGLYKTIRKAAEFPLYRQETEVQGGKMTCPRPSGK